MKAKILCAALALGCALALGGCAGPNGNVEELLTAPRTGADQSAITAVLDSAASSDSVLLKYPRSGSYLSPFVFTDLSGDGVQEAVVFYSDEMVSKNVRVAVLENVNGAWQLLCEMEGLGTEIDSVELSHLYEDDTVSLVVGYTSVNLSDKHLAVYNFKDNVLTQLYEQSYSEYTITDFTGNGTDDLAAVSPETQPGTAQLNLITVKSGAIATLTTLSLDTRLQSCVQLAAGKSEGKGSALIVDGTTANGIATDVLCYQNGKFVSRSFTVGKDLVELTGRTPTGLRSRDTNGDGAVEVPVVLDSVRDADGDERWLWVGYYDFAGIDTYINDYEPQTGNYYYASIESVLPVSTPTPQASASPKPEASPQPTVVPTPTPTPGNEATFGLYDMAYDCFVPLPADWKNEVALRAMSGDDWCLVRRDDPSEKLLIMQVVEKGGTLADNTPLYGKKEDYTQVGSANNCRLYVRVVDGAARYPTALLANITVMN